MQFAEKPINSDTSPSAFELRGSPVQPDRTYPPTEQQRSFKLDTTPKKNYEPSELVPQLESLDAPPSRNMFIVHSAVIREPSQPTLPAASEKVRADGSVRQIEENFVICDIYTEGENVVVRLAKDLFPDDVFFGMPFSLSIVEQNGYRRPEVKRKAPPAAQSDKLRDELRARIAQLSE